MPPQHARQHSAKIADVLQLVHNPRTPAAAKQQTLRRLDGLAGLAKRRSHGHEHEHEHEHEHDREQEHGHGEDVAGGAGVRFRRSISDDDADASIHVAPDGSLTDRARPTDPGTHPDCTLTSTSSSTSSSPAPSRSGTQRRVNFMDEWEHSARVLAGGQKVILHEPPTRDAIRQN